MVNVAHVRRYVRSRSVARWKKLLGVLSVAYAILPFDIIPDVVPVIGWLDDLGFLAIAFAFIARDMAKHAKLPPEEAQSQLPPSERIIDGSAQSR